MFIDLARALAVVAMVYGHTIDALLDPVYRSGTWFNVWQFQRGLTSCLFLLLSGFAFSIATVRHWAFHVQMTPQLVRRTRRFAMFIVLGYALHFPVGRLAELGRANADQWRSFLQVDVLQLIGVTFLLVQLLVFLTRTRRAFLIAALIATFFAVLATPFAWAADWDRVLPIGYAAYLAPTKGSQFPMFPWAAYVLLGAALGQIYARWGAMHLAPFANYVLLIPGTVMITAGLLVGALPAPLFGNGSWNWVPPQVTLRAGTCLIVLAVIAHGSAWLTRMPHAFGAVAQETLLIYFVHLCIVYGSIWNLGLAQRYGPSLGPGATAFTVAVLLVAMGALAVYWNWQKHVSPRAARWISAAAWLTMAGMLV
jgi:acyltransferase